MLPSDQTEKMRLFCLALIFFGLFGLGFIIFGQGIARIDENLTAIYLCAAPALVGFLVMGLSGAWELAVLLRARLAKNRGSQR